VSWLSRLRKPIALRDGRIIRTIADARDLIAALPDKDQRRPQWQSLAALLVSAAQSGNATLIALVTDRLRETLASHGNVSVVDELPKKPSATSVRRGKGRRRTGS
jgi:hypothetical protein